MPRHVDPEDTSFRRSLLRAAAGGLAALVVTFGVTALLTKLGRDDGTGGPAVMLTTPTATPTVAAVAETEAPTPDPVPTTPDTVAPTTPAPVPTEVSQRPVAGVTVQVLQQVGYEAQGEEAAAVLRELGYEVVAVNLTDRRYDTTTVLATPGHRPDAEQLVAGDPRFGDILDNDGFTETVDLHVVVGPDFSD